MQLDAHAEGRHAAVNTTPEVYTTATTVGNPPGRDPALCSALPGTPGEVESRVTPDTAGCGP